MWHSRSVHTKPLPHNLSLTPRVYHLQPQPDPMTNNPDMDLHPLGRPHARHWLAGSDLDTSSMAEHTLVKAIFYGKGNIALVRQFPD